MNSMAQRNLIPHNVLQALPPTPPPFLPLPGNQHPYSSTSFPIVAILVIGVMITSFILMAYYILVIKCCLNLQSRFDPTARISLSNGGDPSAPYSATSEPRGLEEAVIRLIPVIHYEGVRDFGERTSCECSVCLSEFQEGEKLRVIPNCNHVFHIDCIDVWLQNNVHCPLCRRTISLESQQQVNTDQIINTPRPSPHDQSQNTETLVGDEEGFVVIDLDSEDGRDQNLLQQKNEKKLKKVTSLGNECVGVRATKDEGFFVQPMRRSFSVDSSVNNTLFYGALEQALHQQSGHVHEAFTIEACGGSGRVKRSYFSFGLGSRQRNDVLPIILDP